MPITKNQAAILSIMATAAIALGIQGEGYIHIALLIYGGMAIAAALLLPTAEA